MVPVFVSTIYEDLLMVVADCRSTWSTGIGRAAGGSTQVLIHRRWAVRRVDEFDGRNVGDARSRISTDKAFLGATGARWDLAGASPLALGTDNAGDSPRDRPGCVMRLHYTGVLQTSGTIRYISLVH